MVLVKCPKCKKDSLEYDFNTDIMKCTECGKVIDCRVKETPEERSRKLRFLRELIDAGA